MQYVNFQSGLNRFQRYVRGARGHRGYDKHKAPTRLQTPSVPDMILSERARNPDKEVI